MSYPRAMATSRSCGTSLSPLCHHRDPVPTRMCPSSPWHLLKLQRWAWDRPPLQEDFPLSPLHRWCHQQVGTSLAFLQKCLSPSCGSRVGCPLGRHGLPKACVALNATAFAPAPCLSGMCSSLVPDMVSWSPCTQAVSTRTITLVMWVVFPTRHCPKQQGT